MATNPLSYLFSDPSSVTSILILFVPYYLAAPTLWTYLTQHFTPKQILFYLPFLSSFTLFWLYSGLLYILDVYERPKSFWRYKVQPQKRPSLSWYVRAAKQALFVQLVINLPLSILHYYHLTSANTTRRILEEEVPSVAIVLRDFFFLSLIEEIGFYYGHRLLHSKLFYKSIHKKHHEFTAPIGMAAIYAHPFEHFLSNVLPLALGPVILQSHFLIFLFWINFGQMTAINSHCGFFLPGFPSPLAHDYHHQVFQANYGVLGILDWWHGTQGNFVAWKEKWSNGVKIPDESMLKEE